MFNYLKWRKDRPIGVVILFILLLLLLLCVVCAECQVSDVAADEFTFNAYLII